MKKIKLVLIHLVDMFDYYILHHIVDMKINLFWKDEFFYDLHHKFCTFLVNNSWWGEEQCKCFYCKKMY